MKKCLYWCFLYPLYWLIFNSFLDIYHVFFSYISVVLQHTVFFRLSFCKIMFYFYYLIATNYAFYYEFFLVAQILVVFFFLILKLRKLCIPGNLGMGFMVFRISSGYDLLDPDSIVLNILGVCVCACVCTSVRTRTHTCSFVCSFPVSAWTPTETAIWRSLI